MQGAAFTALGIVAGLLSAFFGIGGGWVVTPVLLLIGLSAPDAVGTSMAFLVGTGALGAARHARHGGVDVRLGVALGVALVVGVEMGRRLLLALHAAGQGEAAVQWTLLVSMAVLAVTSLSPSRGEMAGGDAGWAAAIRRWCRAGTPRITVRSADAPVPVWVIAVVGLLAGLMGGTLGLGGGVILVPAMVSLMGVENRAAVATSLVGVAAAGLWGAAGYAAGGHVNIGVAVCMVAGALLGVPVGVRACRAADARRFRRLFGLMMLLAALSLGLARVGWRGASLAGLLLSAGGLAVAILTVVRKERPREDAQ